MSDTAIRIDRSYNEKLPLIQSSTLSNAPQVNLDVEDLQKTPLYYQTGLTLDLSRSLSPSLLDESTVRERKVRFDADSPDLRRSLSLSNDRKKIKLHGHQSYAKARRNPKTKLTKTVSFAPEPNPNIELTKAQDLNDTSNLNNAAFIGRLSSYCVSNGFNRSELRRFLKRKYNCQRLREVLYFSLPKKSPSSDPGSIFIFPYGVVVFWDLTLLSEREIMKDIEAFREDPYRDFEYDDMGYTYGEKLKISNDEISLDNESVLTKLAVSHGVAQSTKLAHFEKSTDDMIMSVGHYPTDLARRGKIGVERKEIYKKMGSLFLHKTQFNLNSDILDIPEFFWEYPDIQHYWKTIANYLDINQRVDVLNRRLEVVQQLFDMLNNEIRAQHDTRLEWLVICLMIVEVLVEVLGFLLEYFVPPKH
eukprot:TRINITY_DN8568_c0_g1_i1.p1 TRINITY_DN8568_c0_g1~~TRINITY_DN8568_c0_g1_i1.p1  ORF type:complete len:418 (+),score=68.18 TRINITY_DN8568_c0_g1_i1:8-1261(+)